MTPQIGIMQGRLSPPIDGQIQAFPANTWQEEFGRAASAGLDAIEWIFDARDNPLVTAPGADRVRALVQKTGVAVRSVCADYFMDASLVRGDPADLDDRVGALRALLRACRGLGVRHVVLPFVDQSAIEGREDRSMLTEVMAAVSADATAAGMELHLETSLGPDEFASLLAGLPPVVRANYDSGNSASLGFDVREEFAAYGDRVGSVHIKDRVRGAGTVPLGSGSVDFPALFDSLTRAGYRGLYTLQVARGETGDEVAWARRNRAFVLAHLEAAAPAR